MMAQQLMDMIARMIARMTARISGADGVAAMAALVPAATGGMAKQAQSSNGLLVNQLAKVAASYTGSAASDGAAAQGNEILGGMLGSLLGGGAQSGAAAGADVLYTKQDGNLPDEIMSMASSFPKR